MFKTYKLLKEQKNKKFENYSNEELALIYQASENQAIIAQIFCKNFNYLLNYAKSVLIINDEDKASIILESIQKAIKTFNPTRRVKLLTYIRKYVYNAFGAYKIKSKYKNRDLENTILSLDDRNDDNLILSDIIANNSEDLDRAILKLTIDTDKSLSLIEKSLCNLLIDNPNIQINEISKEMNITTQYVWIIKKNLSKKLKVSLCFEQ